LILIHNNTDIKYSSPIESLGLSDRGDDTQRNFRYQHAYGVILLVAGMTGKKPYSAIWCEHHEDLLCERHDGRFDAFQIKTRQPEHGYWSLTDEALKKSIKRFVLFFDKYCHCSGDLAFVSNADFLNVGLGVKDRNKLGRSPVAFLSAIDKAATIDKLVEPFNESLEDLRIYCECESEILFQTLKHVRLILGPDRKSFDAEISHNHLPRLDECKSLNRTEINRIRDEIIYKVYLASSLYDESPEKHWQYLDVNNPNHSKLLAKKITSDVISECMESYHDIPFSYSPGLSELSLDAKEDKYSTLAKKMIRGGLVNQLQTMKRRTLSTENRLLELSHSNPESFSRILNQLECVVQAECDEAHLDTSLKFAEFGGYMLNDVYKRLKKIATEEPGKVENQSYECLTGMAGLLTEDCKIWWSEKFDLEAAI
jgi:hypothetical protein